MPSRHRTKRLRAELLECRRLLTAEIEGFVWNDSNRDGDRAKPDDEYRVSDVTVNLLSNDLTLVESTVTDKDGVYKFPSVEPGRYVLEFFALDGTAFTNRFAASDTKDSDPDQNTGRTDAFVVQDGDKIDNIDAGLFSQSGTSNIKGHVWNDRNADGMTGQAGEIPIAGAEVQLENIHGEKLLEFSTDENGEYLIPGETLLPGDYVVDFVRPDGDEPRWQISPKQAREDIPPDQDSDAGETDGKTDVFTLLATAPDLERESVELSVGFFRSATVSGFVWHDRDRNGSGQFQSFSSTGYVVNINGEFGVQAISVRLLDQNGQMVKQTKTDRYGRYHLVVPTPGQYSIEFERNEGIQFTVADQGSDSTDSDADVVSGRTPLMSISALQQVENVTAGIYSAVGTQNVTGRVWHDLNANGIQDPGEAGVGSAEVQIENGFFVSLLTARTDANGEFSFDGAGLLPGTYHLDFKRPNRGPTQDRWQISPRNEGPVDSRQDNDAQPTNGKTPPISLTTVQDQNARGEMKRDAAFFQFAGLSGQVWNDANANGIQDPSEASLPGVRVQAIGERQQIVQTVSTDDNGAYLIDSLVPGNEYSVRFVTPTDTVIRSPGNAASMLPIDPLTGQSERFVAESDQTYLATIALAGKSGSAKITGHAWDDVNGDGVRDNDETGRPGVQVRLLNNSGSVLASTVSGADGAFEFAQLSPAGYRLEFIPPLGSTLSPQNRGTSELANSDVNRFSRQSATIPISAGQVESSIDVGIYSGHISSDVKSALRITEVGFISHGNAEFAEVKNIGDQPIDLTGVAFTNGFRFEFDNAATRSLFPGEHAVVVGDFALLSQSDNAVAKRFNLNEINIAGVYAGDLNRQEQITLRDRNGDIVTRFQYDDDWFIIMDDEYQAWTLTVVDETADISQWNSRSNWRPSSFLAGTPGYDDPKTTPDPGAVQISEVLTQSSDGFNDLIEIHNSTDTDIDISYWYLGDSGRRGEVEPLIKRTRYRIAPGTILPANGYLVFSRQDHFGNTNDPGLNYPFGLSSFGESVHIIAADKYGTMAGYSDSVSFPSAEVGMSFGRHITSDGNAVFTEMPYPSFGAPNPEPTTHALVIDAVSYKPNDNADEFIRLYNSGDQELQLSTAFGSWAITGAVEFQFRDEAFIRANERVFITAIEPAVFRDRYDVPAGIQIFGPYEGVLNNSGDSISVLRPGTDGRQLLVDGVAYRDQQPWPTSNSGGNAGLLRKNPDVTGAEPANWIGFGNATGHVSSDGLFLREFNQTTSAAVYGHDVLSQFVFQASAGDANGDGIFNSRDFVLVFQSGEYQDGIAGNSDWVEGDWNGDGEFDSSDLVAAFQAGTYVATATGVSLFADVRARLDSETDRQDATRRMPGAESIDAVFADEVSRDDLRKASTLYEL